MAESRKDTPILMGGPLVVEILADRKTQTRRPVKDAPLDMIKMFGRDDKPTGEYGLCPSEHIISKFVRCPYGGVGDRLWARETWNVCGLCYSLPISASKAASKSAFVYAATPPKNWAGGWRPSIHMPRWASRIDLEVTDVRVQRVQDISEEDARQEGLPRHTEWTVYDGWLTPIGLKAMKKGRCYDDNGHIDGKPAYALTAREAFKIWWEHIYGPESWFTNPWVWAVSFKRVQQ